MPGTSPGMTNSMQRVYNLDKPELRALAFCKLRDRLSDDDVLEVPGLLVIGERGFAREHFVEEEFVRLDCVLVDLKLLNAGLPLGLRQEFLQQAGNGGFLAGIGLPKRRDDQALVCAVVHDVRSGAGRSVSI